MSRDTGKGRCWFTPDLFEPFFDPAVELDTPVTLSVTESQGVTNGHIKACFVCGRRGTAVLDGVSPSSAPTTVRGTKTDVSTYDQGKAAIARKDWATAITLFREVVTADPGNADAWNFLGYSTRKSGNPRAAIPLYDRALKLNARHLGALEYQGEPLKGRKRNPQAPFRPPIARRFSLCGLRFALVVRPSQPRWVA